MSTTNASGGPEQSLPPIPAAYDWEAMRAHGHKVVDFIFDYQQQLARREFPCQSQVQPNYLREKIPSETPPLQPASFDKVINDVKQHIVPGMTHWQHPDFFAFFPAMVSPPALLGDMMSNAFNQPGFNWIASPAATELEVLVTNWLCSAFGFPREFTWNGTGGCVLQPSATEAAIVVMLAAKNKALSRLPEADRDAALGRLVAYVSDQAHFCVEKAAKVLSVTRFRKVRTTRVDADGNFEMAASDLRFAIEEDVAAGMLPFFVSANFGATGVCAIDPVADIGKVCKDFHLWLNVDAAYAGVTAICEEMRPAFSPVPEVADSILINGSKWFSMMFNSSFMFFRDRQFVVSSLNATGVYLSNAHTENNLVVDFKDYHLGLGRPFRALKVYATLTSFGIAGLQDVIRRHIVLAKYLHRKLEIIPDIDMPVQTKFGLVSFAVKRPGAPLQGNNDLTMQLLKFLTEKKQRFVVHTVLADQVLIRISLAHPQLEYADMNALAADVAEALLALTSV